MDNQKPPETPLTPPVVAKSPSQKKSPVPKKAAKGGKGIILSAREYCEKNKWSPFDAPRAIADDPKVNASIRLQASMVFITRIEPELQAVQIPVKKDEPHAAVQSTPVTEGRVVKLVDKT